jgi:FKBP-type peptidyl-prolyl cis-trans isomerase FkpA
MAERQKKLEEASAASAEWLAEIEKMEGVQKTESGLLYRIDREGSAVHATADDDTVEVNYEGKTRDGNIFDSSYERGESISFALNRVIKGWTEGMKLIGEGGQITLWIPAELAYGERGAGADIGPNEALEFKVELIKVTPAAK